MSPVRLVCDSTADLDQEFAALHDVTIVPLRVIFGEEQLRDGYDITPEEFYRRMRSSPVHPRTSQPTPAEFEEVFRGLAEGGESILCTTVSEAMSGTFSSATKARAALPDLDIRIVDTRTCAAGHGEAVRAAVARRDAGAGAGDIARAIEALCEKQRLMFTVDTLEYLRRGGRIGGARAMLGAVLSIKPVLQVRDGKVEALDRVRTFRRAVDRLFEEVARAAEEWGGVEVVVAQADAVDHARSMAARVFDMTGSEPTVGWVGPVVGCHVGPGAVGLAFHPPGGDPP